MQRDTQNRQHACAQHITCSTQHTAKQPLLWCNIRHHPLCSVPCTTFNIRYLASLTVGPTPTFALATAAIYRCWKESLCCTVCHRRSLSIRVTSLVCLSLHICTSVIALLAIREAAVGGDQFTRRSRNWSVQHSITRCNMHQIATYNVLQRAGGGRALRCAPTLHESHRGGPLAAGIAT